MLISVLDHRELRGETAPQKAPLAYCLLGSIQRRPESFCIGPAGNACSKKSVWVATREGFWTSALEENDTLHLSPKLDDTFHWKLRVSNLSYRSVSGCDFAGEQENQNPCSFT